MNSSFTGVNRELLSPSLLYVKGSACNLVGICFWASKKWPKVFCWLQVLHPLEMFCQSLTIFFFVVPLINSSKNFKWEKFWLYVRETKGTFQGKCVLFHKMWWHGDWETVQSWCLVPAASSTPKLLDLVGSTKTSCSFPSTPFLNSLSDILSYTLVQQLLVFSHFFSQIPGPSVKCV